MKGQITVGYSATPASTGAVQWAANEAEARNARLRIVSCYDVPITGEPGGTMMTLDVVNVLIEATSSSLGAITKAVAEAHPKLMVDTEVCSGPATHALVAEAAGSDLLVVGSSSHEGAAAFWLGNTARWVIRHSTCPVVVVRGSATGARPKRVVVGVDGSQSSNAALRWAADEADRYGVGLLVVHGWSYPYRGVDFGSTQARDLMRIDAACVLDRSVERAREWSGIEISAELREGAPAWSLLEIAKDGDLLVLGSRGRGAIRAGLFGSTVNHVLEQAAVPVVVVKSQ